jgi:hypothetical protein
VLAFLRPVVDFFSYTTVLIVYFVVPSRSANFNKNTEFWYTAFLSPSIVPKQRQIQFKKCECCECDRRNLLIGEQSVGMLKQHILKKFVHQIQDLQIKHFHFVLQELHFYSTKSWSCKSHIVTLLPRFTSFPQRNFFPPVFSFVLSFISLQFPPSSIYFIDVNRYEKSSRNRT